MKEIEEEYLAWFLGPKAENADLLEEHLLLILRDYIHWRRNYFPGDKILISKKMQKDLEDKYDAFSQRVIEMLAELRRNFPFYSPRYIAHMLSDTSLPSMIGYFMGMLYNPNNVTPEAATVTVDWEIKACNQILKMLGYNPPPSPPASNESMENYFRKVRREFGWAHITSGGTIANIEALWIARVIKYFPLSVRDVAIQENLSIEIKRPDGTSKDIKKFQEKDVLHIKPNESIYLLAKYVDAVRKKYDIPYDKIEESSKKAWNLLNTSKYSLSKGLGEIFHKFPPAIFVSGSAHYSIHKAADVLGIGRDSVVLVKMDSMFRMNINDLEKKIKNSLCQGKIPLAVVAIAGTTEEGTVDPIHKILDMKEKFEREKNVSFWLHIDAAWGGYIRSLFSLTQRDTIDIILSKISNKLGMVYEGDIQKWHNLFLSELEKKYSNKNLTKSVEQKMYYKKKELSDLLKLNNVESYMRKLGNFLQNFGKSISLPDITKNDFKLSLHDRVDVVKNFVKDEIELNWNIYRKKLKIMWGQEELCSAFIAFPKADSITVDPHKMGYVPYPCGVVAFKNDRVRHFILQRAPYITSVEQNVLVHMPPKHPKISSQPMDSKIVIESFGPFIMEGSRPGASASSLWLSIQTIPLIMKKHGLIVKASLLAARELYEWLAHWNKIIIDSDYEFVPLTSCTPDTNVVIFSVRKKTSSSLRIMNRLTKLIYEHFTIQVELGEGEYSYSQPFFLSKTYFREPEYPFDTLSEFYNRCKLFEQRSKDDIIKEYKEDGLVVLRATVMNPYLYPMKKFAIQNLLKQFMQELSKVANESVNKLK